MSHAAAEACTQRLAAGRGHGYRLAAPSLQSERGTGRGKEGLSLFFFGLLNVNDDQSAQCDKLLDGSRDEAPSQSKSRGVCVCVSVRASAR